MLPLKIQKLSKTSKNEKISYKRQQLAKDQLKEHIFTELSITKSVEIIKKSIDFGTNSITKTMELAIKNKEESPYRLIIVCKNDINAPLLAHIPTLCHLTGPNVFLCVLEKGQEKFIAESIGMHSVLAIGIKVEFY